MFSGCQSTFMPYIIYSFHSFYFPQLETKASDVMQSISSLRTRRECPTDGLQTSHCRLCSFPSRAQSCSIPQHTQSPQGASRGVVSRRHVHRATNTKTNTARLLWHLLLNPLLEYKGWKMQWMQGENHPSPKAWADINLVWVPRTWSLHPCHVLPFYFT